MPCLQCCSFTADVGPATGQPEVQLCLKRGKCLVLPVCGHAQLWVYSSPSLPWLHVHPVHGGLPTDFQLAPPTSPSTAQQHFPSS